MLQAHLDAKDTRCRGVVLAVDDNPHNLQLLAGILQGAGYAVRAVNSGARALRVLERELPDLVLLDIDMPELDGYAVCRAIQARADCAGLPVIFISAYDDVAAKLRGFEAGAVDYVSKPFEAAEVLARVDTHLRILHLRQELESKNASLLQANTELERSRLALESLAYFDTLTGIANRRNGEESLAREWNGAARDDYPVALAMIDVDHFKKFNDRYGHAAVDDCLQRVAKAMASRMRRPRDLLARFGGEEFIALLPHCELADALEMLEALRAAVEALDIPHADAATGKVTVSIGVAVGRPATGLSSEDCLATADAALYRAKHAGRNRIVGD